MPARREPGGTIQSGVDADFVAGRTRTARPGHAWRDERPHDWTLLMTLAGRGAVEVDGRALEEVRGSLLLIAPRRERRFRTRGPWDLLWFHFPLPGKAGEALSWPAVAPGIFSLRLAGAHLRRAADALTEAVECEAVRGPGWAPLARCLVESVLKRGNALGPRTASAVDPRLLRARDLLRDYRERRSVDAIGAACGLSRSVLYQGFKDVIGMSPRRYRETRAIARAQRLLEGTRLSMAEIADQVGMPNVYYFSARFRKLAGMPPSRYRAKAVNQAAPSTRPPAPPSARRSSPPPANRT